MPDMAALPSLRQLQYLLTLQDTLNFTQAAARCHVTQSTLSGGIQELERLLDAPLVERDRQKVMITPIGQEVCLRAQQLLSQSQDLVSWVQAQSPFGRRTLSLGAIPTIAPFLLPALLRQLREYQPQSKWLLQEEQTATLLERVRNAQLDFALIALPLENKDTQGLNCTTLGSEELWLLSAAQDPVSRIKEPRLGQLDITRMMILQEGHCLREHALLACPMRKRHQHSEIEASSLPTLVQMVEAGLGLALLPEMAIKAGLIKGTPVVARPLASPAPKRHIALVSRSTSPYQQEAELLQQVTQQLLNPKIPMRRHSRVPTTTPLKK